MVRADLQEVRAHYFNLLLLCVGVVGLGVILEGPEAWHEFRKAFGNGKVAHHGRWVPFVSFVGWVLVAGGIVCEGVCEGLVSWADGTVQTFDAELIEAGRQQTDAARGETDVVRLELAQAETELLKLREKQIPRRLSSHQKSTITLGLRQFEGQYVRIEWQMFAPDQNLARDLTSALGREGAKWNVDDSPTFEADRTLGIKVKVYRFANDRTIAASRALVQLIRREGHLVVSGPDLSELVQQDRRGPDDYAPTVQMLVIVGRKP